MLALRLRSTHPINRMRDEMECLFDQAFSGFPSLTRGARCAPALPPINVWEDADSFHIEVDLPGLALDDVELTVTGDELTIQGTRKAASEAAVAYHRTERPVGDFARVIRLPEGVNARRIEGTLKDGVLSITLPKPEEAKPRKIAVNAP